ncbi:chromosome segregation protein SMC [Enterococcus saccharolyticus]|uniref:chromosome segregation protein SMC n=1 Tax=Enterococcus saccharolyticus TaxID=41997 RepID=UPI001E3943B3|nr:chromosome segregation protein SMC [Enterococcus saccharolyticus]MCD5002200.1 chromosome segregation protein SMC [Enterococcus saccharolyticus]
MYLKRIEIAGFKSFADRTVIDFENSVTAIVGPNGSGKSNITEAIRWVLGEQSAKNLRGGKMPDIIFAGSDSRKSLNIAEVTVVLDNTDHYLPVDYSEISVTRRLRRTGESDFYLNKQACRLKDIQELFMDSGLGKESFSIISQGKVEAIFSSKPEDRRGIFEEAAGVLKYKQRKKQAEQKLFETEDNLSRVQDIIYELEDQMAPLAEQSKTAKLFLKLKETFTQIDVAYTVAEMKEAKAVWDKTQQELETIVEQLETIAQAIHSEETKLHDWRLRRSELDQQLEEGNQKHLRLVEALKQAEGQREVLFERSKHTQKSNQEYQESLENVSQKLEELEAEKAQLIKELSQKNGSVQQLEKQMKETEAELHKYQKTTKELIEDLRGQYVDYMQEQANIGNELKYLERQHQQELAKNQHALEKQATVSAEVQEKEAQLQAIVAALTVEQEKLSEQRRTYTQTQEKAQKNQQQFIDAQKKMYQLMNDLQQVKARQKSLQDIQENYTGFYQGVRLVLQHKKELSGIVGAVAELIDVPKEYTLAIETALGGAAQHIVVEEERDARAGITFLKNRRGGRATFLPLTTIKPRPISEVMRNQASMVEGFLGMASELVSFPDHVRTIVENLLGPIVIAQDLQSANQLARTMNYRYRVVSLEGDVMNAGGSMTGGAMKRGNQGNLFGQTNELQELTNQVKQLDERLHVTEKQVQQFESAAKEAQAALETLRHSGETARMKEQELSSERQHLQTELERLKKEQQIFAFENREVQLFFEEYAEQKEVLTEKQQTVEKALAKVNQEMEELGAQEDLIEEKRATLSQTLSQLQADFAVNKEQATHLQQKIATLSQSEAEYGARKESLERQIAALSMNFSDHEMTEEALDKQVSELTTAKETLQQELQAFRDERYQLQQTITLKDEQVSQLNIQQKETLAKQTKVEVENNRAELVLDNRLHYLQEEYQVTFEAAETMYPTVEKNDENKQEIQRLRREIDALGPVNLNAIELYQQVKERHSFLTGQRDDLLSAKGQLFDTMSEMDEEVKTRFKTVFEGIRQQFKVVFPNMFGGGRAELILTDPTDLLNTGIEIEAQPPGKKLQNLSLLSGGERALTAIALLFSIIQVCPVPFCVLDEVEAALDEANVLRFGHYLRTFQNDTQFIVVTHRKGTMEAANVLYGVTMQESGVSKIVSVRLEDVSEEGKIVEKGE